MTRLFPILYLAIIATLVAAFFSSLFFSEFLMGRVEKDSYTQMYSAPFVVLNDSVEGLAGEALEQKLDHTKAIFKFPVDLVATNSIKLTAEQSHALENGNMISINREDGHTLFSKGVVNGMGAQP